MYPVDIDFDEASKAWRANKRRLRTGAFRYCCPHIKANGKKCKNPPTYLGYCTYHKHFYNL